jgi:hypothetical protein
MAHIEKRRRRGGVVWRARYRAPDGAERSRTFARRSDAEAFLTKVEDSKLRGEWVDPSLGKTCVREYADQWLTTKADVAPRTFVNIEARLRMHVVPHFGSMPLNRVRPSHVRALVADLVRAGYAPGTVKATYQIVAQIFAQAALDGLVARSPCVGIELPRDRHREEMRFLEAEQVNALADAVDDRFRALIYTAAYGGLRAGELAALSVRRLDLLARTLHVAESAGEVRGRLVVGPTKTGKVARSRCRRSWPTCSANTSGGIRRGRAGCSPRPRVGPFVTGTSTPVPSGPQSFVPASPMICGFTTCGIRAPRS